MKLNADFSQFAATRFDSSKYIASPSYGVNRFMLDRIGDEKARATTIVEYKPNSRFPEHKHIGGEEFIVLKGTFKDQFGSFSNTYVRNPIDSVHAPWVDDDGCTIFVKLLQMADTGEGTKPLHVNLDDAHQTAQSVDYGKVAELYTNSVTREQVQMLWIDPNKSFPTPESAGGEELFILEGSLLCQNQEYDKWGWLRFPISPVPERETLQAGPRGAQVYCKSNHLTPKALSMEKVQIADDETYTIN